MPGGDRDEMKLELVYQLGEDASRHINLGIELNTVWQSRTARELVKLFARNYHDRSFVPEKYEFIFDNGDLVPSEEPLLKCVPDGSRLLLRLKSMKEKKTSPESEKVFRHTMTLVIGSAKRIHTLSGGKALDVSAGSFIEVSTATNRAQKTQLAFGPDPRWDAIFVLNVNTTEDEDISIKLKHMCLETADEIELAALSLKIKDQGIHDKAFGPEASLRCTLRRGTPVDSFEATETALIQLRDSACRLATGLLTKVKTFKTMRKAWLLWCKYQAVLRHNIKMHGQALFLFTQFFDRLQFALVARSFYSWSKPQQRHLPLRPEQKKKTQILEQIFRHYTIPANRLRLQRAFQKILLGCRLVDLRHNARQLALTKCISNLRRLHISSLHIAFRTLSKPNRSSQPLVKALYSRLERTLLKRRGFSAILASSIQEDNEEESSSYHNHHHHHHPRISPIRPPSMDSHDSLENGQHHQRHQQNGKHETKQVRTIVGASSGPLAVSSSLLLATVPETTRPYAPSYYYHHRTPPPPPPEYYQQQQRERRPPSYYTYSN